MLVEIVSVLLALTEEPAYTCTLLCHKASEMQLVMAIVKTPPLLVAAALNQRETLAAPVTSIFDPILT